MRCPAGRCMSRLGIVLAAATQPAITGEFVRARASNGLAVAALTLPSCADADPLQSSLNSWCPRGPGCLSDSVASLDFWGRTSVNNCLPSDRPRGEDDTQKSD